MQQYLLLDVIVTEHCSDWQYQIVVESGEGKEATSY